MIPEIKKGSYVAELFYIITAFFPVGFQIGSNEFFAIEILAPLLVLYFIYKLIAGNLSFVIPNTGIYYSALLVLLIWAVLSWIRYPVFGTSIVGDTSGEVGLKSYMRIISGISVFLVAHWYTYFHAKIEITRIARFLAWFSLIIGAVRIFSYFFSFEIPFLYGTFRYNPRALDDFGGIAYRVSGIDIASYVGIFAILTIRNSGEKFRFSLPLLVIFLLFLFLNAGRSSTYGIILALLYYMAFIEKLDYKKLLAGMVIVILFVFFLQFIPKQVLIGQFGRITAIEGGIQGQYADRRGQIFKGFMKDFLEHPILGRGIRPVSIGRNDRNAQFIEHQLTAGGHGSYHSLIGIFGIGGIYFIFIFLFLPIIQIHFLRSKYRGFIHGLMVFLVLNYLYRTLFYYASGRGYADYSLYLLTGVFAATYAKHIFYRKQSS